MVFTAMYILREHTWKSLFGDVYTRRITWKDSPSCSDMDHNLFVIL